MAVSSGECGVPFVCCWRQEDRMQEAGMAMFRDFLIKNKRQKYSCLLLLAFSFSAGYNARLLVVLAAVLV